jgi:hypothetical protein
LATWFCLSPPQLLVCFPVNRGFCNRRGSTATSSEGEPSPNSPLTKSAAMLGATGCWVTQPMAGTGCCASRSPAAFCQRTANKNIVRTQHPWQCSNRSAFTPPWCATDYKGLPFSPRGGPPGPAGCSPEPPHGSWRWLRRRSGRCSRDNCESPISSLELDESLLQRAYCRPIPACAGYRGPARTPS